MPKKDIIKKLGSAGLSSKWKKYMRLSAEEKADLVLLMIRLNLCIKRTLIQLGIGLYLLQAHRLGMVLPVTVIDDYSRYTVHYELCRSMEATDVKHRVKIAMQKAGLKKKNLPKLLSDNGPCYIAQDLEQYIDKEHNIPRFMVSLYNHKHRENRTLSPFDEKYG